jgi:hypothetical protein
VAPSFGAPTHKGILMSFNPIEHTLKDPQSGVTFVVAAGRSLERDEVVRFIALFKQGNPKVVKASKGRVIVISIPFG